MGQTRNWGQDRSFSDAEWTALTTAAQDIIETSGVDIAGPGGYAWPRITGEAIALNGRAVDDGAGETFHLTRVCGAWAFCKTGGLAYDLVVAAILVAAQRIAPDVMTLASDTGPESWTEARELCDLVGIKRARRMAESADVMVKARGLAVAYMGSGVFNVTSGTTRGKRYTVSMGFQEPIEDWVCSCPWGEHGGAGCAHVKAVALWIEGETVSLDNYRAA